MEKKKNAGKLWYLDNDKEKTKGENSTNKSSKENKHKEDEKLTIPKEPKINLGNKSSKKGSINDVLMIPKEPIKNMDDFNEEKKLSDKLAFLSEKINPFSNSQPKENNSPDININLGKKKLVKKKTKKTNSKTCEELSSRDTHYIFTFGHVGSGKSTFLAAISLYIMIKYNGVPDLDYNQEGAKLVLGMIQKLKSGTFPKLSQVETAIEFDIQFNIKGEEVNFTFIEMSGETLTRYDILRGEEVADVIDVYLQCPDIDISFLLVADYQRLSNKSNSNGLADQDLLTHQFLSKLYNRGVDMSRIGLILSKFDLDYTTKHDIKVEETIRGHMPITHAFLTGEYIDYPKAFPFSIGEVQEFNNIANIKAIELGDCEAIVDWIREGFEINPKKYKKGFWKGLFG